ncbi:dihydroxy-acid dehydratase [Kribbella aluminosa]|uniref:Dihydroxy-acid dehydratase n=1 Tax=Kribbella aluminosa TaxID=416017 RepID=A0ABS4UX13_9ACTN|nr:IlvD/Edd family dehydratase [Kribbella aluminosa]MBP2356175.1 dihydroxy-acid dehydratase [Kribbella aluminosa]
MFQRKQSPSSEPFRSAAWLQDQGKAGFIARSHLRALGLPDEVFDGRPVVGIANSFSELNPCNSQLRTLAEHVKRGVIAAGGLPLEFPTISLGEPLMRPTTMLFRNLMAMDVEETLRANPVDAVVLLGGCDKTIPAQLMGAASVDLPTLVVPAGPMMSSSYRGEPIGSGTDIWRFTEEFRVGRMTGGQLAEVEGCMSRSAGTCMTMGTASTMACAAEALGLALPGTAAIGAMDARRQVAAERSGRRVVELAREGLTMSRIVTRDSFENAVRVNAAIGGSTNFVLHLLAIAGRSGVELSLDDIDAWGSDVPLLVDLKPSGRFLMDDFAAAGGLPVVMREILPVLRADALTVTGHTVAENVAAVESFGHPAVRTIDDPVQAAGNATAVLRGNLAPDGAVIKVSAATPALLRHRGPALVFDSLEQYHVAAADPELEVGADTVLILRQAGPRGYPGMPEVGNLPIPVRLLEQGVTDMVRITDARMSGTAYGTIVLHVAPESAVGGPLAFVRDGDLVELDVVNRKLHLVVDDAEFDRRRQEQPVPRTATERGWVGLYRNHVLQADEGVDLDFLRGGSGHAVPAVPF